MTNAESEDIEVIEVSLLHKVHKTFKQWFFSNPIVNSIILFCLLIVVISGALAFFIMVGAINFKSPATKALVLEINFQILTIIFTIATIVDQPQRIRGLFLASSFVHYKSCAESAKNEKNRNKYLMKLDKVADSLRTHFNWLMYEVDDDQTVENDQELGIIGASRDSVQTVDYSSVDINRFLGSMVAFNVSTLGQLVVSIVMFCIWPYQTRPILPIAICTPVAFAGSAIGGGYQAFKKHQMQKYHKSLGSIE